MDAGRQPRKSPMMKKLQGVFSSRSLLPTIIADKMQDQQPENLLTNFAISTGQSKEQQHI